MNMKLNRILRKLQKTFFPTEHDLILNKFYLDGGEEKLRYDYDLDSNSLVIDLGGYKGQWTSDIYSRYNCRLLVFEPVESFYCNIIERFKLNDKIEVFNLALGANNRKEVISLNADGSSLHIDTAEKETIQFEDVSTFFVQHRITHVDLLKINIEGGEYELLQRIIATGLIKDIQNLQIQFHNICPDSEVLMEQIIHELYKTHKPTYQYKFVWENWVRIKS